jgi:hypothetical protein
LLAGLFDASAGVHIVEATKQVYRAILAACEPTRLIPALEPVLVPSSLQRRDEGQMPSLRKCLVPGDWVDGIGVEGASVTLRGALCRGASSARQCDHRSKDPILHPAQQEAGGGTGG